MTISSFQDIILSAKDSNKKVAIIYPHKKTILESVKMSIEENIAEPILLGDEDLIRDLIGDVFNDDYDLPIHNTTDESEAVYLGCQMVKDGKAHSIMKGYLSTSIFLKGILDKEKGLNIGRFLSHIVVIEVPAYHKLLFVTDGGMNPHPDLNTKVNIAKNAIETVSNLGIENPKVACLAGVETVNENQPETLDCATLVEMNLRGQIKDAVVDGPLAMDLAVNKEAAEIKGITGEVVGDADILLVPNMAVGNIMAKSLIHLADAKSGGVVVGAYCPIILLSRADDADTKKRSIALGVGMST